MREFLQRYVRYTSWPIILSMLGLMIGGVLAVHATERGGWGPASNAGKQLIWMSVALGAFVLVTVVPYQRIGRLAYPMFGVTIPVLLLLFFLPSKRESHRWIDLGFVQIQPSEIAKLTYIIMLAWYLRYRSNYRRLRGLAVPFVLTFLPMALILPQPDLGTSLLFLPTLYMMLFIAGAKLRHLLGIVAAATAVILLPIPQRLEAQDPRPPLSYAIVELGQARYALRAAPLTVSWRGRALVAPHQVARIEGWLHQGRQEVAKDKGYQLRQSKTVLGAGEWTGCAGWEEADVYFRMLPEYHTDFIFSIIGGYWGLLGCLAVLGLYAVIFIFGVEIATITDDPFGRLLAVGVLALLFSQIIINVGMTMGLMPITGMTLPLVSYGGSSLVANCAALGLLINVGQHRPLLLGPKPFEHDRTG